MRNSAISTKKCQLGATSKTAQISLFFQHRVFLSSVTRAALWSSRFQEKFPMYVWATLLFNEVRSLSDKKKG